MQGANEHMAAGHLFSADAFYMVGHHIKIFDVPAGDPIFFFDVPAGDPIFLVRPWFAEPSTTAFSFEILAFGLALDRAAGPSGPPRARPKAKISPDRTNK